MKKTMKSKKGFTLIEMLGVLGIIAILISVVAVGVMAAINRSRIVATVANMKNFETALLQYMTLPTSGGTIPLTKTAGAITVPVYPNKADADNRANEGSAASGSQTMLHLGIIFRAAGTLERYPTWRVGNDGIATGGTIDDVSNEYGWSVKSKAFYQCTGTPNNWTNYIRAEASIQNDAAIAVDDLDFTNQASFKNVGAEVYSGCRLAYLVMPGLSRTDAKKLSEEINGSLHNNDMAGPQLTGKFMFGKQEGDGTVEGYYFLAAF